MSESQTESAELEEDTVSNGQILHGMQLDNYTRTLISDNLHKGWNLLNTFKQAGDKTAIEFYRNLESLHGRTKVSSYQVFVTTDGKRRGIILYFVR